MGCASLEAAAVINSRNIDDLHPIVAKMCFDFKQACQREGIAVIITSTYRDHESQAALFAQGRTKQGRIVTWAKPGQSLHNHRLAFDYVPLRNGKLPVWGTNGNGVDDDPSDDDTDDLELWQRCGAIGKSIGLEWAGDWPKGKREFPHFQYTGGLTLADLQAGKKLENLA